MVSRRGFLGGGVAALGLTSFASAAQADQSNVRDTNFAVEMARHVDYFLYKEQEITASSLQGTLSADSWDSEKIARGFAQAWTHLQSSTAGQKIIDDYQNNEGSRFFSAFIAERGRRTQSVPTYINDMFDSSAQRAFTDIQNGGNGGNDFTSVHDTPFRAFLRQAQINGGVDQTSFDGVKALAVQAWQDGFDMFVQQTLLPSMSPDAPAVEGEPAVPAPALNFGNN